MFTIFGFIGWRAMKGLMIVCRENLCTSVENYGIYHVVALRKTVLITKVPHIIMVKSLCSPVVYPIKSSVMSEMQCYF